MERTTRLYKFVQISSRRYIVQTFVYYPDADVSRGPYCLNWEPIKKRDIPKLTKLAKQAGLQEFDLLFS